MNGKSEQFPVERRLIKTDEFSSVFRFGVRQKTKHFALYAQKADDARLGIVVAKRLAPRAVTRNTIKRICREVFRRNSVEPFHYIVRLIRPICSKDAPANSKDVRKWVKTEIEQLFVKKKKTAS